MKLRIAITVAAAVAMVGMVQSARASLATESAYLNVLANGGSLSVGDKTFTGFGDVPSGLTSFDASGILVTATEVTSTYYTLTWVGNISLTGTATASADLFLSYTVTATGGGIGSIDQSYTGGVTPPGQGTLLVTETAYAGGVQVAKSTLDTTLSQEPPITYVGDNLIIDPAQSTLNIDKDIVLTIDPITGPATASISGIEQSFEEVAVPEASTIIAGALLLLPFGASTLRILRRNRMA